MTWTTIMSPEAFEISWPLIRKYRLIKYKRRRSGIRIRYHTTILYDLLSTWHKIKEDE
jgi:hypothetical protein